MKKPPMKSKLADAMFAVKAKMPPLQMKGAKGEDQSAGKAQMNNGRKAPPIGRGKR